MTPSQGEKKKSCRLRVAAGKERVRGNIYPSGYFTVHSFRFLACFDSPKSPSGSPLRINSSGGSAFTRVSPLFFIWCRICRSLHVRGSILVSQCIIYNITLFVSCNKKNMYITLTGLNIFNFFLLN